MLLIRLCVNDDDLTVNTAEVNARKLWIVLALLAFFLEIVSAFRSLVEISA